MNVKKTLYITIGCVGVVVGFIGAILPLLPTFPFLLLAAICFAKGSTRLHTWFVHTNMYKNNLESYIQGKGMSKQTKWKASILLTLSMGIGFIMMQRVPVGQFILCIVWISHLLYFMFSDGSM